MKKYEIKNKKPTDILLLWNISVEIKNKILHKDAYLNGNFPFSNLNYKTKTNTYSD